MASFATACRLSARLVRRTLTPDATARGFRTSAAALAAQNFTMPALSPTMTEGNIAAWRVKEGEKFSAGDVLLEIETDKATMDVEAQEDGILMKVMQGDGSKGVLVGTRIAVLAEEGDDISSLEIPPDEAAKKQAESPKQPEPQASPAPSAEKSQSARSKTANKSSGGRAPNEKYPLYPSVAHLMKQNGLDKSVVKNMVATGPNGRLLKGDVLAYLGKVKASAPVEGSSRFQKLAHLDLSNIKVKAPEAKKPEPVAAAPSKPAPPVQKDARVTVPLSLAEVIKVQTKIKDTLGIFMPLSTFIERATEVANDELPLSAGAKPSADELFNQVLGLDKVGPKSSRGSYLPQIEALNTSFLKSRPAGKQTDIIDILAGTAARTSAPRVRSSAAAGISTSENLVSLVVPQIEEKRAKIFLERLKIILEREPGRLVL